MKCIKCGKETNKTFVAISMDDCICLDCYEFDKSKYTIIDSSVILVSVEKLNGLEAENRAMRAEIESLRADLAGTQDQLRQAKEWPI